MSKVLVDRELLLQLFRCWDCGLEVDNELAQLRIAAAQPAEAEGVVIAAKCVNRKCLRHNAMLSDYGLTLPHGEALVRQSDHLAALSAVTAERDAAQKDAERYRWASSGVHEAETLVSIVNCHGGYAEKVAERVDVYREAAMAAKEA